MGPTRSAGSTARSNQYMPQCRCGPVVGNIAPASATRALHPLRDLQLDRDEISLGGTFPLCVRRPLDPVRETHTIQVGQFFHTEVYDVRQLVFVDYQGLYPWQPGCLPPFAVQAETLPPVN